MRLFLPGWEGNTSVKWLRRIKVTEAPTMTRDETSKYSDLRPDGSAQLFSFQMGVKSIITSPSGQQTMRGPGLYQISGLPGQVLDVSAELKYRPMEAGVGVMLNFLGRYFPKP